MTEAEEKIYIEDLHSRLDTYRFNHSLNVARCARALAERYGASPEDAYKAGLMHDIYKNESKEGFIEFFTSHGVKLTDVEKCCPKLWHAMAGEIYLREKYSFPEELLAAVRYHTTGRSRMSLLEKIIYIADFISDDRDYNGVERMREKAEKSLEEAMEEGLQFTIAELVNGLRPVHPDTIDAFNELLCSRKE